MANALLHIKIRKLFDPLVQEKWNKYTRYIRSILYIVLFFLICTGIAFLSSKSDQQKLYPAIFGILLPISILTIFAIGIRMKNIMKGNFCQEDIEEMREILMQHENWLNEIEDNPRESIYNTFVNMIKPLIILENQFLTTANGCKKENIYIAADLGERMKSARKEIQKAFDFISSRKILDINMGFCFNRAREEMK